MDDEGLSPAERIRKLHEHVMSGRLRTAVPLLPVLFNWEGAPLTLKDHFPFEELFYFLQPKRGVYKTGRQVAKSTSVSASGISQAVSIPNFKVLYVTPLFEQVRKLSSNYVQPLIRQSPVKRLWVGADTTNSVLQQSFKNQSKLFFNFAFLDADRIRGTSVHAVSIDEAQDMQRAHLPVIMETMAASPWAFERYTGTPKTLDNTLEGLWSKSSMAEWFIPCTHCTTNGYPTWNIPAMEHHLDKMIGPVRDDIGEGWNKDVFKTPGIICHACRKPIYPRLGRWVHRHPDRVADMVGFHIPQIILPLHYASREKWADLHAKRQGQKGYTTAKFYNEVMGESYDTAAKLVTVTELKRVSNLGPNDKDRARLRRNRYRLLVLGVDWGGGGEEEISFTTLSLVGFCHDGRLEVPWGMRLMTPHDHIQEARDIRAAIDYFRPHLVAHDYTGAGALRETFLVQSGVPQSILMPCQYVGSARKAPCYYEPRSDHHPRDHWSVDKSRTLLYTCAMIKLGAMRFFDYDHQSDDDPGLISHFLNLIEEKTQTLAAGEVYRIDKAEGFSDDFAQATNLACVGIWHSQKAWPNIADLAARYQPTAQQLAAMGDRNTVLSA